MDLQAEFGTSYVFISHNLSVVEHIADDVMVMYFGGVAELGDKTHFDEAFDSSNLRIARRSSKIRK